MMYKRNSFFYLIFLNISLFTILSLYIHLYLQNESQVKSCQQTCLHLNDLEQIKRSLRNELQYLETKRSNYLFELSQIKRKIRQTNQSLSNIRQFFDLYDTKLDNRRVQLSQLDLQLSQKSSLISNIQFISKKKLPNSNKIESNSIESCVNLNKCYKNLNLKLFINQKDKDKLDLNLIQQSLELTDNAENACFSLVLISAKSNLYELLKILKNYSNKTNFVFVNDYSDSQYTLSRQEIINKLDDPSIVAALQCAFFTSFIPKDSMSLNFGIFGSNYLNQCDLTAKRQFLFFNKFDLNNTRSKIFFEIYKDFPSSRLSNLTDKDLILKSDFLIAIPSYQREETVLDLIVALNSATIPVLFDLDFELPLPNLIAWDEIIIRLSFNDIQNLPIILDTIPKYELIQRRIKARMIFKSYFKTRTHQLKTVMAVVRDRLRLPSSPISELKFLTFFNNFDFTNNFNFSQNINDEYLGEINQFKRDSLFYRNNHTEFLYKKWNFFYFPFNIFPSDPFFLNYMSHYSLYKESEAHDSETRGGGHGKFFHSHLSGNFDNLEQFTMVILTFNREELLVQYLERYFRTVPYLNSILVVWNSVNTEPKWYLWQNLSIFIQSKRLQILKMSQNSLNNRFLPFDLIKTEAVLSLDDDVYLRPDEIVLAFRIWRENRERIVGFPARYHTFNTTSNQFMYKSYLSCEYSLVLTGAAFYHKFYNYYYSLINDKEIREKVDELMNCEDIAFNMMVAHLTRKAPIKVTTRYSFYCSDCQNLTNDSPISLRGDHYLKRSKCIEYFIKVYGYNPLLYSQFRADSVLYRTKLYRNEQRCFKMI